MTKKIEKFSITEDHIKLLKRLFFEWESSCYDGAPAVDIKRPYGNSYPMGDICEILDLPKYCDECESNSESLNIAEKLHREMQTVLQIICCTASVEVGEYAKEDIYDALS